MEENKEGIAQHISFEGKKELLKERLIKMGLKNNPNLKPRGIQVMMRPKKNKEN